MLRREAQLKRVQERLPDRYTSQRRARQGQTARLLVLEGVRPDEVTLASAISWDHVAVARRRHRYVDLNAHTRSYRRKLFLCYRNPVSCRSTTLRGMVYRSFGTIRRTSTTRTST